MSKILIIIGTMAEAVRLSPIILRLQQEEQFKVAVAVIALELSIAEILDFYNIKSGYAVDLTAKQQSDTKTIAKVMTTVETLLGKTNPELVVIYGHSDVSLGSAIASSMRKIKFAHIGGGIRNYNIDDIFPFEINRRIISSLASYHFVSGEDEKMNLIRENITDNIAVVGSTAIDNFKTFLKEKYFYQCETLNRVELTKGINILVTLHKENPYLEAISIALLHIIEKYDNVRIIIPTNTLELPLLVKKKRIHLIETFNIADIYNIIARSYLVVTDETFIQEEAGVVQKPVLLVSNSDKLHNGVKKITFDDLLMEVSYLIDNKDEYNKYCVENIYRVPAVENTLEIFRRII